LVINEDFISKAISLNAILNNDIITQKLSLFPDVHNIELLQCSVNANRKILYISDNILQFL